MNADSIQTLIEGAKNATRNGDALTATKHLGRAMDLLMAPQSPGVPVERLQAVVFGWRAGSHLQTRVTSAGADAMRQCAGELEQLIAEYQ